VTTDALTGEMSTANTRRTQAGAGWQPGRQPGHILGLSRRDSDEPQSRLPFEAGLPIRAARRPRRPPQNAFPTLHLAARRGCRDWSEPVLFFPTAAPPAVMQLRAARLLLRIELRPLTGLVFSAISKWWKRRRRQKRKQSSIKAGDEVRRRRSWRQGRRRRSTAAEDLTRQQDDI
jgi:hypothetical protein